MGISPGIYTKNKFKIVKNYEEFVKTIISKGLPELISFDHDLADIHYEISFEDWNDYTAEQLRVEMTGLDCAKWLVNYCIDNKLKLPVYYVHSMNPVGRINIISYLDNYKNNE